MKINRGDIIVCAYGFYGNDNKNHPSKFEYGGTGYVEGLMRSSREDSNGKNPTDVHWGFYNDCGVYNRSLRLATKEEIIAFEKGITNIHDIVVLLSLTISYMSLDGELKKQTVEASSKAEALASIKDLKTVNYVMGDDSMEEETSSKDIYDIFEDIFEERKSSKSSQSIRQISI